MTADLFPGFKTQWIETEAGRFFVRTGGHGPPLLLLHGYPQTHAEWHKIARQLAEHYSVVLMDLRGYGQSFVPASREGDGMSKRLMGQDAVAVMAELGHTKFRLVGHDRGGRVAYRLAFDRPEVLEKVAVVDIIPTASMFRGMDKVKSALTVYHWLFLARPAPFPETMIGASARYFLDHTLASWTATKDLSAFDPLALAQSGSLSRIRPASRRAARTIARACTSIGCRTRRISRPGVVSRSLCWRSGGTPASPRPAYRPWTSGASSPAT